jgi:hypothetical protein
MHINWKHAYVNGFAALAEDLYIFRPGDTAIDGKMNASENQSLPKRTWLDGCLGVEPSEMG